MSNMDHYHPNTLNVMACMFLLSPDGQGVDLVELDELVRTKHNLTTDEADAWFMQAAEDGAVNTGPERLTN